MREPNGLSNRSPALMISWDPSKLHITGEDVAEELATTKPRIAVGSGGGRRRRESDSETAISITAWMMQPGEDQIVADRIHGVLSQKRSPKPTEMTAPAGDISGHWDVDIEYFSSKSQHSLFLEQNNNWIQGSHTTDFGTRELLGTIEGDQVTLRSQTSERGTGDSITFIFSGSLSGDTISGPLYLGEYLERQIHGQAPQLSGRPPADTRSCWASAGNLRRRLPRPDGLGFRRAGMTQAEPRP